MIDRAAQDRLAAALQHDGVPGREVFAIHIASRPPADDGDLFLDRSAHPDAPGRHRLEYFLWAVREPGRVILVDTGFRREVGESRGRIVHRTVPDALSRLGIRPEDVDDVIVTHAHWDHCGELDLFPQATFHVARAELDFWRSSYAERTQVAHASESTDLEALEVLDDAGRVVAIDTTAEIAHGVLAEAVGGHTPGQLVVGVGGSSRPVLLASDAVHLFEELERDRPFAVLTDLLAMYDAYDLIRALHREVPGLAVVPGHDERVLREHPDLGGGARRLA